MFSGGLSERFVKVGREVPKVRSSPAKVRYLIIR